MNPTTSEMLDPWTTRLYTSRPYWSVPIGWIRSGARSAATMSILVGLCGATRFWPSATSARAAMMPDPTTAPLCRRTRGASRAQGAAPARAREGRATSAVPDPRVDRRVEHGHREVEEDVRYRPEQDTTLHTRASRVGGYRHRQRR